MTRRLGTKVTAKRLLAFGCAVAFGAGGCGDRGEAEATGSAAGIFDATVTGVERRLLVQDFDHHRGPVKVGAGWSDPQTKGAGRPWASHSWATKRAVLYFARPAAADPVLVMSCVAPDYPDQPPQQVEVWANGAHIDTLEVPRAWAVLRTPLPPPAVGRTVNTLTFNFAWAAPSTDYGGRNPEPRSAACDYVAVLPRSAPARPPAVRSEWNAARGQLTLAPGSVTALGVRQPVPEEVVLGAFPTAAADKAANLVVAWVARGVETVLAKVSVAAARSLRLRLPPELGELRISTVEPTAGPVRVELEAEPQRGPGRSTPPADASPDPPIVLYVVDTLRADALGVYGASRPTSPRIDTFARDGIVFERAWSTASWTLPATVSILTGRLPYEHRHSKAAVVSRPRGHGPERLPEALRRLGYRSVGITQTYIASEVYGIERGFDAFYVNDRLGRNDPRSDNTRWFLWQHLLEDDRRPLFLYVHTVEPHAPYAPPDSDAEWARDNPGGLAPAEYNPHRFMAAKHGRSEADRDHLRALYDGDVRLADRRFGEFIDLLQDAGLYAPAAILLTSDHGEEFYEHGGFDHSRTLFDELLHVPLVVKLPAHRLAGARIAARASLVDLFPTALALAGGVPADDLRGDDLVEIAAAPRPSPRPLFAETSPEGTPGVYADIDLATVVHGDLKCIHSRNRVDRFFRPIPEFRAFDTSRDPGETTPLPLSDQRVQRCIAQLKGLARTAATAAVDARPPQAISPEERARLTALGYL